ncbi:hypothetical protein HZF05_10870 [Sphingomonas sp. CGMCC 1.13654]|uniref:Uncharacterized protein n=1 Tax=Sphingomonas chungangi TaxID=2683589 RepID=A0A838L8X7_9SPHN|nr:hypothetical protein [Sphingomonas chungangi]MBA2934596.1 hypothetical protein [Sphingomonas chungangi]MVW57632.1 hypothetical protein [Sphingomonas chungangi]
METIESRDTGANGLGSEQSPRAFDWFWRPWYAKLLVVLAVLYWVGLYTMLLMPVEWLSGSVTGGMVWLILLFNPFSVIAILGFGFLKAKVACGDWIILPGAPLEIVEWQRREREAAYINPADARSGYMHQDHLDGR